MNRMTITFIGVAIFILLCWWLAYYYAKKTTNLDEYIVAGRAVGFWVLIGSWVGGAVGGASVAGFVGYGWEWGMSRYWTILPAYIFLLLFVLIFGKKLSVLGGKHHLVSIPDFLALRFGNKIRVPGVFFIFFRMGFIVGLQILSLGLIFSVGFGISKTLGMLIGFTLLVGYVALGGMMASIVVEWLQSVLQSIVMIALCVVAMITVGNGNIFTSWTQAQNVLDPAFFDMGALPLKLLLTYLLAMGVYYFADQWAFQRVFVASKPEIAFKSLSIGNIIVIFFVFLPFVGGVMLRAAATSGLLNIPLDIHRDQVFFHYVINILPTGAGVFFLVCYMASVLSCGSAFLMGGAPLVVRDLYQTFLNPDATGKQLVKWGRIGVLIVAVVGVIGAYWIPFLVELWIMGNAFTACGLVVPVLAAFFWRRATSRGALASSWIGGSSSLIWALVSWVQNGDPMVGIYGLHPIMLGLSLSLLAMIVFSLTDKPQTNGQIDITYWPALPSQMEEV